MERGPGARFSSAAAAATAPNVQGGGGGSSRTSGRWIPAPSIALEKVVEAGLELPGFSTFDKMASKIRTEVTPRSARASTTA
jgi:hypothetical protein